MTGFKPLINRLADDDIAFLSAPLPSLQGQQGIVTAQQFLNHVANLAKLLPEKCRAINLCQNRYLFMVALCAVVVRKQTNLLPSNKNIATQTRLHERYEEAYVLHDGVDVDNTVPELNLAELDLAGQQLSEQPSVFDVPLIELSHLAAISFTSGSTGDAKPNLKTWHTFVASTEINQRYMLANTKETFYQVATVPGQHMWGLETSVLMAMFANVCVADAKPLYPLDIQRILKQLPSPRALVSTPLHLRALVASQLEYPELTTVLCATSPLNEQLAEQVEQLFNATLWEVYGCSEVGSMAVRKTAHETVWQGFKGLNFSFEEDQMVTVSTAYLPKEIQLEDQVEPLVDGKGEQRFNLLGRATDAINIAGKRGSLSEVNKVLLSFTELKDGIVFFPEQNKTVQRLAALVILPEHINTKQLSEHFRNYLDSAFIPRPIIRVASLPREDNGKLPQKKLLALYQSLIR